MNKDTSSNLSTKVGTNCNSVEELEHIIEMISNAKSKTIVSSYIREPLKASTPAEKVKKRPDGYDYVESAWMDKSFKEFSPLYKVELVLHHESMFHIDFIVSVTDRLTGNTELGAGSSRIQVRRGVDNPGPADIINKGNNLTAALTLAIKNAQSRFGHAADIYGKCQEVPTDDEKTRFKTMFKTIKGLNPTRAYTFEEQWNQLGHDFTEYLNNWDIFIERSTAKSDDESKPKTKSIL
jgi:hypothetical protein